MNLCKMFKKILGGFVENFLETSLGELLKSNSRTNPHDEMFAGPCKIWRLLEVIYEGICESTFWRHFLEKKIGQTIGEKSLEEILEEFMEESLGILGRISVNFAEMFQRIFGKLFVRILQENDKGSIFGKATMNLCDSFLEKYWRKPCKTKKNVISFWILKWIS